MKHTIIISVLFLFCAAGFSQGTDYGMSEKKLSQNNMYYGVRGKYTHPIKKERLTTATNMGDIIPDYPSLWIESYVSSEISTTCNGKVVTAVSKNNILSLEQKNILTDLELGTEIVIDIKYKSKNSITNEMDISHINYSVTLVPEIEAEYSKGSQELTNYLKENIINKITESNPKHFQDAKVRFTVNEEGKIAGAQISKTSGDVKIDKLLLEAINKMPEWKPAQNEKGVNVKQVFEFSVHNHSEVGC